MRRFSVRPKAYRSYDHAQPDERPENVMPSPHLVGRGISCPEKSLGIFCEVSPVGEERSLVEETVVLRQRTEKDGEEFCLKCISLEVLGFKEL